MVKRRHGSCFEIQASSQPSYLSFRLFLLSRLELMHLSFLCVHFLLQLNRELLPPLRTFFAFETESRTALFHARCS
nr:hypothetical protein Iba_chr07bCG15490 [Ipomoea batatas]